jgi:hypothetical protein
MQTAIKSLVCIVPVSLLSTDPRLSYECVFLAGVYISARGDQGA